jgi:hypothetical protein
MPSINKQPGTEYTEDANIPSLYEYSRIEARANGQLSIQNKNIDSLQDLILDSKNQRSSTQDPNFSGIGGKNAMLGIPSFLTYPLDLGTNKRFHHFIVFNIYQGTSDEITLKQREINQMASTSLAKGGMQFGGQLNGIAAVANESDLRNQGFTPKQIREFIDAYNGATGSVMVVGGITANERILAIDKLFQGQFNNIFGDKLAAEDGTVGVAIGAVKALAAIVGDITNDAIGLLTETINSSIRDYTDPANQPQRNENQVGASGRKVNRQKNEQGILLANRRFNFANTKSKDTICLYMPLKISFNDQLIYSENDMGMTKNLLDALAGKRGASSALLEKAGVGAISNLIGKATSSVGLESINVQSLRNANTRSVTNPRRETLFSDVTTRTHSFSFEFAPRNVEEAQMSLDIIKMLRYHAYPGLLGGGGHFFTFPAEFEATFYTIDPNGVVLVNDNLPKMGRLALQSVSVDYSGAGDFKTFKDAKPAFMRMDLAFSEMEQLTSEHIIHGY